MVFSGLYPADSEDYDHLRQALEKLKLNDASLEFIPETSEALGLVSDVDFRVTAFRNNSRKIGAKFNLDLITTTQMSFIK